MENNINNLITSFNAFFNAEPELVCSCGGRFEILGNHTDHNHGMCIASACNLEIIAAIRKRKDKQINLKSIGYPVAEINLDNLEVVEEEKERSEALIRGVAYYLNKSGYRIGGFDAYAISTVFKGAGVSSSAAFELLVGHIFNTLYNDEKIPKLTLCKAGQYAENEYFGKKSGLLDQIGVGYGGIVQIDFKDIENPEVEQVAFPFKDLHFIIINTGGDHSTLSDLYSSIPMDMYSAANEMKQRFLRDTTEEQLEDVKDALTESQYLRARHFFTENIRVKTAINALKEKNKELFLQMINESRISSTNNLKNMMVEDHYEGSPLEACDMLLEITENNGAVKINGGGFAGSCIAVVPTEYVEKVITKLSKKYGEENVVEIFIREDGPKTLYNLKK